VLAGCGLALAALSTAAVAQPRQGRSPVRVEFRAVGDDGHAITDLKSGDLTLKVNGKPRTLRSLTVFAANGGVTAGSAALPPPYAINLSGQSGRTFHVLIDDDSIAPGRESPVRDAIRILASELSPMDRLGVLTPQGTLNIAPSGDFSRVKLAVNGFTGRAASNESEQDAQCRTTHVLKAVGTMISMTGEAPTTLIVFSGGLTPPAEKIVELGRRLRAAPGVHRRGGRDRPARDLQRAEDGRGDGDARRGAVAAGTAAGHRGYDHRPRLRGRRAHAIGGFNVGDLPPGDYLMRAIVSLDGTPVGMATRTLRKAR